MKGFGNEKCSDLGFYYNGNIRYEISKWSMEKCFKKWTKLNSNACFIPYTGHYKYKCIQSTFNGRHSMYKNLV